MDIDYDDIQLISKQTDGLILPASQAEITGVVENDPNQSENGQTGTKLYVEGWWLKQSANLELKNQREHISDDVLFVILIDELLNKNRVLEYAVSVSGDSEYAEPELGNHTDYDTEDVLYNGISNEIGSLLPMMASKDSDNARELEEGFDYKEFDIHMGL